MTIACPAVLYQRIDSSKFSETHREDPAIPFDTEGGWVLTRPRFTRRPPVTYTLGFTDLSDTEKGQIQQLYEDARGGSEIITGWVHPVSGASLSVRFKQGAVPQYKYHGFGGSYRWDVSNIIIEEV